MSEDRVRSGILGLDELMEGGFPRGFGYAIVGGPGTGKSTFGAQFLYKGTTLYGENGVYITFEEPPYSIANNMRRYGWNLYDAEERGKLAFVDASPVRGPIPGKYETKAGRLGTEKFNVDGVIGIVSEAKRSVNAKRCVVDPVSALTLQYKDDFEMRWQVMTLMKALTEMRLTTLLLSESMEERADVQRFGVVEFSAQGVIVLHMYRIGDSAVRALEIRKMRGVKHQEKLCPYKFTLDGIEVYPQQTVFTR